MSADSKQNRRSMRLKGFDYSHPGMYFVTICATKKQSLFGIIKNGKVIPTAFGAVVREEWLRSAELRPTIKLDSFIVMPNHFHGIIAIEEHINEEKGTARRAPTVESFSAPVSGSVPTILRAFKSAVTRRMNRMRKAPGMPLWQRGYYEHVIRSERELDSIRKYIVDNPLQWEVDHENPEADMLRRKRPWEV